MTAPARRIDYFFSCVSPWSFLGHAPFMAVARRHQAAVTFHPVELGPVFAQTGGLPLARRAPERQRYRLVELQRWRDKRGIALNLAPAFWPLDGTLADQTIIAALQAGLPADALIARICSGIWQRQENLAVPEVIAAAADDVGLPGAALVAAAGGKAAASAYLGNREKAIAADVFGAPSYVLDGEVFWGQDRIELLDEAIASGRPPFRPMA
ncbi:2-hydroxychromene-2-carboxylate isomerase [Xanthobacter autotrophicus]|uniref:2-hydroxychromene-2-carboxylate isomerase n=1 Tax=Xanthobacter TaxID=279 RepID=UPI0024ABC8BE|nr:2-hydroxychromene-2-carboxylate isomerase [Xanthobacter autotrophicus]MDI4665009.1 2-hydroxychromene-2-carboxylate isomerase [Xanthobacter autotrophicus]